MITIKIKNKGDFQLLVMKVLPSIEPIFQQIIIDSGQYMKKYLLPEDIGK